MTPQRQAVLDAIREHGPIGTTALAKLLGRSSQWIRAACLRLLADGLIEEVPGPRRRYRVRVSWAKPVELPAVEPAPPPPRVSPLDCNAIAKNLRAGVCAAGHLGYALAQVDREIEARGGDELLNAGEVLRRRRLAQLAGEVARMDAELRLLAGVLPAAEEAAAVAAMTEEDEP